VLSSRQWRRKAAMGIEKNLQIGPKFKQPDYSGHTGVAPVSPFESGLAADNEVRGTLRAYPNRYK